MVVLCVLLIYVILLRVESLSSKSLSCIVLLTYYVGAASRPMSASFKSSVSGTSHKNDSSIFLQFLMMSFVFAAAVVCR